MNPMLHIFRKDVRRLWWAVAGSLALLATLAWQDRWRSDYLPGPIEGWLNVIVPFAWACLLGLVVEQDPLVGDRQFWITRPHRRAWLLGGKLLFALVFVHGASFLADVYILAARGFSPLAFLPQLLGKQVLLAGALTLPALALAALFRNFTQFMLAALCVVAAIVILTGTYQFREPPIPLLRTSTIGDRLGTIVLLVATGAIAIVALQYFRRKTNRARFIGLAVACIAAAIFSWMPQTILWAARAEASRPREALSLALAPGTLQSAFRRVGWPVWRETVMIPLKLSGLPAGQRYRLEQLELEIVDADGQVYRWQPRYRYGAFERVLIDALIQRWPGPEDVSWLVIQIDGKLYARIKDRPVTVRGKNGITLSRVGTLRTVRAVGTSEVSDRMRCIGTPVEDRFGQGMWKFECESPAELPNASVKLAIPGHLPEWVRSLGDGSSIVPYIAQTWLSPLNRRQTFIPMAAHVPGADFSNWLVPPPEIASRGTATVTPEFVTGRALVSYEIKGIRLSDLNARELSSKP